MDVATVITASLRAREKLAVEIAQFRDGLDELKFRLGLSGCAVILDRQDFEAFLTMFDSVATWETHPQRKPAVLTNLISKFPVPGEVVNGEPILSH